MELERSLETPLWVRLEGRITRRTRELTPKALK